MDKVRPVCLQCPALTKTKRPADIYYHETCVIMSEEHDVSRGALHPRCPVLAYLRRVAREIELS